MSDQDFETLMYLLKQGWRLEDLKRETDDEALKFLLTQHDKKK